MKANVKRLIDIVLMSDLYDPQLPTRTRLSLRLAQFLLVALFLGASSTVIYGAIEMFSGNNARIIHGLQFFAMWALVALMSRIIFWANIHILSKVFRDRYR